MRALIRFLCLVGLFFPGVLAAQGVGLAAMFGDHMVLQRGQPISVWGTAAPGAKIDVSLGSQKATAQADNRGQWKATLPPMEAAGPLELHADCESDHVMCKDVMIGDVWLISGQSNVVLTLAATTDAAQAKTEPVNSAVRVFKMPGDYSFEPTDVVSRKVP